MQVWITAEGELTVEAGSETEAFALGQWVDTNGSLRLILKPAGAPWDCAVNVVDMESSIVNSCD